ncbi:unnamed protein product [Rhizoctonia solani]|uniref:Uncharacterized protein n=1 Tax=Rhizoctonia solani TaxID=456999 RepID=A0A8H3HYG4_9AGAM|nr:unnamed protein product [Rhizoctonia solani]
MRSTELSRQKQRQKFQSACQTAGPKRSASKKDTLPARRPVSQALTKPSSLSKTSAKTTALRNASPTETKSLETEAPVPTIDISVLFDELFPTLANPTRFSQQRVPTPPPESSSPPDWQPNHPFHPPTPQPIHPPTPPSSPESPNRSLEYPYKSNTGVFDASIIYGARTSLGTCEHSSRECGVFDTMSIYGPAKTVLQPELPQLSRAVLTTCDARVHKPLTEYESSSATRSCNPGHELGIREEELDALSSAIFEDLLDAFDGRKGDLISAVEASLGEFY